ncbi:hypothetical protein [Paenibacillus sp. RUD330]|uniref:hypothetical protein n=1 Tax=Paenibacillus sp. RUD330 TaxID=2023772 RepID=UPI000B928796|nr:hypothetical protein [Paenibacillus sp. RUD330]ASS66231.1 hypothetical protein CIC07_08765 [Paenibacillus sp. RUD330]
MELIDKGKLLKSLVIKRTQYRRDGAVIHVGLLDRLIGEIESGAFDPPTPEVPKFNLGDKVKHKNRPECNDGTIYEFSSTGKTAYVQWLGRHLPGAGWKEGHLAKMLIPKEEPPC